MRLRSLALCALLPLSACGSDPAVLTNNIEGVSYTFDGGDEQLKKVTEMAMMECQRFGRIAVLKNTSELEDDHVANFACRAGK